MKNPEDMNNDEFKEYISKEVFKDQFDEIEDLKKENEKLKSDLKKAKAEQEELIKEINKTKSLLNIPDERAKSLPNKLDVVLTRLRKEINFLKDEKSILKQQNKELIEALINNNKKIEENHDLCEHLDIIMMLKHIFRRNCNLIEKHKGKSWQDIIKE